MEVVTRFSAALICLVLAGCATAINQSYPAAELTARRTGGDVAMMARGRLIYTTSCIACHVARPVTQFSPAKWQELVARMAPRAKLASTDRVAVESYLVAASSTQ